MGGGRVGLFLLGILLFEFRFGSPDFVSSLVHIERPTLDSKTSKYRHRMGGDGVLLI